MLKRLLSASRFLVLADAGARSPERMFEFF
jgi:hypothetical protein